MAAFGVGAGARAASRVAGSGRAAGGCGVAGSSMTSTSAGGTCTLRKTSQGAMISSTTRCRASDIASGA